jgi:hypothetical protein
VWFINFSVVKFRAKCLARTNLFSHYDAEWRHPDYSYTRLDGGLYGVEENLIVQAPTGVFTVEKTQDGRWHIKIDTPVALDRPDLYTFMIIAEDLRGSSGNPCRRGGTQGLGNVE